MDRNSWRDSYYLEEMPQAPPQRQGRPFREPISQHEYKPRHTDYPRDNHDYQSRDTATTFYTQSQQSHYYDPQTRHQSWNESHYPRNYDKGEKPHYSRENSRELEYPESSPSPHFNQENRNGVRHYRPPGYDTNRDSRSSSHSREPMYPQSASRYQQRQDSRHFHNDNPSTENDYPRPQRSFHQDAHTTGPIDRQQPGSKYVQSPNRFYQRSGPHFHDSSENQNTSERHYRRDPHSLPSPRDAIERQVSDPFYPKWKGTPKPRSRCSSTSSSKEDAPRSRDECVICYSTIKILALTPCEHLYCHLCCIRLQILCEDAHCPICRTPFEENPVILLQSSIASPVYRDLIRSCISDCIENFKITLLRPLTRGLIDQLFNHKCPVDDCPFIAPRNEKRHLEKHLKFSHELYYCHVCMQGLKLFVFEMQLYSWEDLNKHKEGKGDSKLDQPGNHGHPLCKFCRDRFLDDSTLYEHLHQSHFWCFICERNSVYVYYNTTEELRIHFRQEHFLCERGECKQEIYTTAFGSEIDFKAHVSSVHAGDLKKNEVKNMRRVDIEFNYVSAHYTHSDQGYRNRKQLRDRTTDQNTDRTDQLSDNEETENNNDQPAKETNQSEFIFKNEQHCPNNEIPTELPRTVDNKENNTKTNEPPSDPISWDDDTYTQSPADLVNNWPQIETDTIHPASIVSSQTTASSSELGNKPAERNNALSYSQSLGVSKQPKKIFTANSAAQSSKPPAPSPYSDIVKPESAWSHKLPSQSKPKSHPHPHPQAPEAPPPSEATKAPPVKKKTYDDVFPALSLPPQTDKQQQVQSTAAPSMVKAAKKSNKQRKKENKTQTPITHPNDPPLMNFTSDYNEHKSYPVREKPQQTTDKSQPTTEKVQPPQEKWPALLPETQPKKKEMSPRTPRVVPPQLTSAILVPYAKWQPPSKYKIRKSTLETHIASSFIVNNDLKQFQKSYDNLVSKTLPVFEFLKYFKTTFGDRFSIIFPEMLVLLPDIGLQQELLEAKEHLFPSVAFLSLPPATSSWSKPTRIQLDICTICTQVLLPSDSIEHKGTHSSEDEFPALC